MMSEAARRGRAAFTRGAWSEVYAQLRAADDPAGCSLADLELPAVAAYLPGRDDECADAWGRAYQGHLEGGDPIRAARCAFWLGWGLFYKGQMAQCAGWFARAQRLVDDCGRQCAEEGLLLVPQACGDLFGKGDAERAFSTFSSVRDIGQFFGDDDVIAFGLLGTGQAPLHLGRRAEGLALLDEAMVAAARRELSPLVSGTVYCAVILECRAIFDLRRAIEWTGALKAWCDSDPQLVPYRGQCLVHRSEIMQLHTRASRYGHEPQPGFALLRLAQGQLDAACSALPGRSSTHAPRASPSASMGAAPDLRRVDELSDQGQAADTAGLTARELEVLALVADGRTNREIAATLTVSEHTVRRHVQNILAKVGVSSRAAATAFALHHRLV